MRLTHDTKGADSAEDHPSVGHAFENGWHGGVAKIIVTSGSDSNSFVEILVTS